MSTRLDDLEVVVRLAILTEHRDPAEQRALLRVAAAVEADRNRDVVTNKRDRAEPPCTLVDQVLATAVDDNSDRLAVRMPPKFEEAVVRHRVLWVERPLAPSPGVTA